MRHGLEGSRRDGLRRHAGLADVLGKRMHYGLVQVLDDAVVGAVDMNGGVGCRPGCAAVEAGQRDGVQAVAASPLQGADDVGGTARRRDCHQHVARSGLGLQLVGEHIFVPYIVGDRRQQFNVGTQADDTRRQVRAFPDAFRMVALEVVGDGG